MKVTRIALLAAGLLAQVGCTGGVEADGVVAESTSSALAGPFVVAQMAPTGLVASTGNLYWTQNGFTRVPRQYWARVYRAAKTNTPGPKNASNVRSEPFLSPPRQAPAEFKEREDSKAGAKAAASCIAWCNWAQRPIRSKTPKRRCGARRRAQRSSGR